MLGTDIMVGIKHAYMYARIIPHKFLNIKGNYFVIRLHSHSAILEIERNIPSTLAVEHIIQPMLLKSVKSSSIKSK